MTPTTKPVLGSQTHQGLIEALRELKHETANVDADPQFRSINDPLYSERARDTLVIVKKMLTIHLPNPCDDVVRGLEVLIRGVRLLRVPVRDEGDEPDERSRSYDTLRGAVGRMRNALDDALDAAKAAYPDSMTIPRQIGRVNLDRVKVLLKELDLFEAAVKRVGQEGRTAPEFVQQSELVRFYTMDMDLEIDLARFILRVNDVTLDLGALVATVEAARDITFQFRANVRDWFGRVTNKLLTGAESAAAAVSQIASGVRTLGGMIGVGGDGEPEMIFIEAGTFVMGVSEAEQREEGGSWDVHARPAHTVSINRPFLLGRYPVLDSEYAEFATETDRPWHAPAFSHLNRYPALSVGWSDAVAYAAWLSRRTGHQYRLPSEAEWEYACRAGTTTARYWGSKLDLTKGNFRDPCGAVEVDAFPPNPWGLYDMLGDVDELVADAWHNDYHGAPTDGSAWHGDGNSDRILRGGSREFNRRGYRAGFRVQDSGAAARWKGFRLARTL